MSIKFDEGELQGTTHLGEGEFEVIISSVKPGTSKEKGTPLVEVEFSARNGRTTRDWFVTQGNKFKLAALALACGIPKEDLLAGNFDTPMLGNKRLRVVREAKGLTPDGKNKYENSYLPLLGTSPSSAQSSDIPF